MAGIRTPLPIAVLGEKLPAIYKELCEVTTNLETTMKDMQVCCNHKGHAGTLLHPACCC